MKHKLRWWYLTSPMFNYTWRIHKLFGIINCKLNKHWWAGVTGKKDYRFCMKCDKEQYGTFN